jgi:hypothetical protein
MSRPLTNIPSSCDLLIVGSGAAGLLAAHETLRRRPGTRVVIVDAGLSLRERPEATQSQMVGFGGAGLYLGGRLYLGPATIPVSPAVSAPPAFRAVLEGAEYGEQAGVVDTLFSELGATAQVRPAPEGALAQAVEAARLAGLEYVTSYPARIMERDERLAVMRRLRERLEAWGAFFAFGTRVEQVTRANEVFAARLNTLSSETVESYVITARALILAPGRYGAEWLVETGRDLGVEVAPLPTAFGVRLEFDAAGYAALTSVNPDPRLQLALPETDAIIKTYATCPGGVVAPVRRYGALVASGVPLPLDRRGPTTTFAALLQPGATGSESAWKGSDALARAINTDSPDALIVQRLGDIRRMRPTSASTLSANAVQPSCAQAVPGALCDTYPDAYWQALDALLARLSRLAPDVVWEDALAYAPAEERFWRFPTDDTLQTSVPGVFVAGDGPGQSQGVIQAGVAGMLAGRGAAGMLG